MMLWKMFSSPKATGKFPFTDVEAGSKTAKAILWAYKKGIIKGTSATTFDPDGSILRAEMFMMLC